MNNPDTPNDVNGVNLNLKKSEVYENKGFTNICCPCGGGSGENKAFQRLNREIAALKIQLAQGQPEKPMPNTPPPQDQKPLPQAQPIPGASPVPTLAEQQPTRPPTQPPPQTLTLSQSRLEVQAFPLMVFRPAPVPEASSTVIAVEHLNVQLRSKEGRIQDLEQDSSKHARKVKELEEEIKVLKENEKTLKEKITDFENFCVQLDCRHIEAPSSLRSLFTRVKGKTDIYTPMPVNRPFVEIPTNFAYQGEMIGTTPSGLGKITYISGISYEGEFLNGQQHGKGKLSVILPENNPNSKEQKKGFKMDQRYIHGVKDGIFCTEHSDGRIFYEVYENDQLQHVTRYQFPDGRWGFQDCKDGKIDGQVLNVSADGSIITRVTHIDGRAQDPVIYAYVQNPVVQPEQP
jgi:hypothetical protein